VLLFRIKVNDRLSFNNLMGLKVDFYLVKFFQEKDDYFLILKIMKNVGSLAFGNNFIFMISSSSKNEY